jgi:putative nucleotidyltransferase with HDIG domain
MSDVGKKKVLFVDDEPNVTQALKRMLRPMRKEWEMFFALSGKEALTIAAEKHIDVIVSDMRMPGIDGAQLLGIVQKQFPNTIRIILSGQSSKESILRAVGAAHQYLAKPCDAETLKQTVSRAFKLRDTVTGDRLQSIAAKMQTLPTLPESYGELIQEMKEDEPSLSRISTLIRKDVAMTAKILQVVNSAYFGIRRKITAPEDAVKYLGLENISALVLAANVFGQLDELISIQGFSMSSLWNHSGEVGRLAQNIMKAEKKSKQDSDDVLTAGLLHDCGKLVFAANLASKYETVIRESAEHGTPLWVVEREELGASHAEIGAFLLGIWGLPDAIVEAVAFHHNPLEFLHKGCTSLTALHVANSLLHERDGSTVDAAYLEATGTADRFAHWGTLVTEN